MLNLLENLSGAFFFTKTDNLFECQVISGDFVKLTGYPRSEFFERFGGDLSKIIIGNSDKIAEKMHADLLKKGCSEVYYEISPKGAQPKKVKETRKLITQRDGSMATICELDVFDDFY